MTRWSSHKEYTLYIDILYTTIWWPTNMTTLCCRVLSSARQQEWVCSTQPQNYSQHVSHRTETDYYYGKFHTHTPKLWQTRMSYFANFIWMYAKFHILPNRTFGPKLATWPRQTVTKTCAIRLRSQPLRQHPSPHCQQFLGYANIFAKFKSCTK